MSAARDECGIILHPAGHTLSPVLHEAAYRDLGLDARFRAHDVPTDGLDDTLEMMRRESWTQLAVSLPHKESVLARADQVTTAARAIGAANTLTRRGDKIEADNTDWIGVTRSLEAHGPWRGKRALVLGAGGAARAVVYALRELGGEVEVANRSRARAVRLVADLGGTVASAHASWDLLVNATSVGMAPEIAHTPMDAGLLNPAGLVFDTVYRPLETRLLREARERGCRTLDGLWMLVFQAVEQVRLWSGRTPDATRLREAALEVLASD